MGEKVHYINHAVNIVDFKLNNFSLIVYVELCKHARLWFKTLSQETRNIFTELSSFLCIWCRENQTHNTLLSICSFTYDQHNEMLLS